MADSKISALTGATTPLAGTEVLPVVQSGATVKVASDDLTVKNIRSNATNGILQIAGPAAASTRVMTTPDANFTAARTDAAQTFSGEQSYTGATPQISMQNTGTYTLRIRVPGATADIGSTNATALALITNGTARLTLSTTGDVTVNTGNLVQGTAAKGINFTANTPAAGMTSQLLNWYEEGTFTPTVSGVSLAASSGYWVRSGKMVFVYLDCTWPTTSDATPVNFRTLPFNVVTGGGCNSAFNTRSVAMVGVPGSTTADGVRLMTQVASADVTNAQMSTHRIQLAGWYNAT